MTDKELLREIIDGEVEVPDQVTNRLLLSAIIHNSQQNAETNAHAAATNALIKEQNSRISKLEDNPSLIYLLRQWPRQSLIALIVTIAIIFRLWNALPPLLDLILALAGIPIP